MGSARGPRHSGWQRRQACPSCPWTRGELGQAAGEGRRRNRLALGSTHPFSPPPPRPGPRQAPPPVRHLKDTGGELAVPRGRAGPQGQLPRARRAPLSHAGLRAWARSSPRTGPQGCQLPGLGSHLQGKVWPRWDPRTRARVTTAQRGQEAAPGLHPAGGQQVAPGAGAGEAGDAPGQRGAGFTRRRAFRAQLSSSFAFANTPQLGII